MTKYPRGTEALNVWINTKPGMREYILWAYNEEYMSLDRILMVIEGMGLRKDVSEENPRLKTVGRSTLYKWLMKYGGDGVRKVEKRKFYPIAEDMVEGIGIDKQEVIERVWKRKKRKDLWKHWEYFRDLYVNDPNRGSRTLAQWLKFEKGIEICHSTLNRIIQQSPGTEGMTKINQHSNRTQWDLPGTEEMWKNIIRAKLEGKMEDVEVPQGIIAKYSMQVLREYKHDKIVENYRIAKYLDEKKLDIDIDELDNINLDDYNLDKYTIEEVIAMEIEKRKNGIGEIDVLNTNTIPNLIYEKTNKG